jgi:hypothetical protein
MLSRRLNLSSLLLQPRNESLKRELLRELSSSRSRSSRRLSSNRSRRCASGSSRRSSSSRSSSSRGSSSRGSSSRGSSGSRSLASSSRGSRGRGSVARAAAGSDITTGRLVRRGVEAVVEVRDVDVLVGLLVRAGERDGGAAGALCACAGDLELSAAHCVDVRITLMSEGKGVTYCRIVRRRGSATRAEQASQSAAGTRPWPGQWAA